MSENIGGSGSGSGAGSSGRESGNQAALNPLQTAQLHFPNPTAHSNSTSASTSTSNVQSDPSPRSPSNVHFPFATQLVHSHSPSQAQPQVTMSNPTGSDHRNRVEGHNGNSIGGTAQSEASHTPPTRSSQTTRPAYTMFAPPPSTSASASASTPSNPLGQFQFSPSHLISIAPSSGSGSGGAGGGGSTGARAGGPSRDDVANYFMSRRMNTPAGSTSGNQTAASRGGGGGSGTGGEREEGTTLAISRQPSPTSISTSTPNSDPSTDFQSQIRNRIMQAYNAGSSGRAQHQDQAQAQAGTNASTNTSSNPNPNTSSSSTSTRPQPPHGLHLPLPVPPQTATGSSSTNFFGPPFGFGFGMTSPSDGGMTPTPGQSAGSASGSGTGGGAANGGSEWMTGPEAMASMLGLPMPSLGTSQAGSQAASGSNSNGNPNGQDMPPQPNAGSGPGPRPGRGPGDITMTISFVPIDEDGNDIGPGFSFARGIGQGQGLGHTPGGDANQAGGSGSGNAPVNRDNNLQAEHRRMWEPVMARAGHQPPNGNVAAGSAANGSTTTANPADPETQAGRNPNLAANQNGATPQTGAGQNAGNPAVLLLQRLIGMMPVAGAGVGVGEAGANATGQAADSNPANAQTTGPIPPTGEGEAQGQAGEPGQMPQALPFLQSLFNPPGPDGVPGIPADPANPMTAADRAAMRQNFFQFANILRQSMRPRADPERAEELLRGLQDPGKQVLKRLDRLFKAEDVEGSEGGARCGICLETFKEIVEEHEEEMKLQRQRQKANASDEDGDINMSRDTDEDKDIDGGHQQADVAAPTTSAPLAREGSAESNMEVEDMSDVELALCGETRSTRQNKTNLKAFPCHHVFCHGCLRPWLETHTTCPTCRFDIDPMSVTLRKPTSRQRRDTALRPRPSRSPDRVRARESDANRPYNAGSRPRTPTPAPQDGANATQAQGGDGPARQATPTPGAPAAGPTGGQGGQPQLAPLPTAQLLQAIGLPMLLPMGMNPIPNQPAPQPHGAQPAAAVPPDHGNSSPAAPAPTPDANQQNNQNGTQNPPAGSPGIQLPPLHAHGGIAFAGPIATAAPPPAFGNLGNIPDGMTIVFMGPHGPHGNGMNQPAPNGRRPEPQTGTGADPAADPAGQPVPAHAPAGAAPFTAGMTFHIIGGDQPPPFVMPFNIGGAGPQGGSLFGQAPEPVDYVRSEESWHPPKSKESLNEWILAREIDLNFRCEDSRCVYNHLDDDEGSSDSHGGEELINIKVCRGQQSTLPDDKLCQHRWHVRCLKAAGPYQPVDETERQSYVRCMKCRRRGWVPVPESVRG